MFSPRQILTDTDSGKKWIGPVNLLENSSYAKISYWTSLSPSLYTSLLFCLASDEETESPTTPVNSLDNLPVGAKLKVRYGKGKNTREYEAKVCKCYFCVLWSLVKTNSDEILWIVILMFRLYY